MKFVPIIGMEEIGEFDTFYEAFEAFFKKFFELIHADDPTKANLTNDVLLGLFSLIEIRTNDSHVPIMMTHAMELAEYSGILKDYDSNNKLPSLLALPTDEDGYTAYIENLRSGLLAIGVVAIGSDTRSLQDHLRKLCADLDNFPVDYFEPSTVSPADRQVIIDTFAKVANEIK